MDDLSLIGRKNNIFQDDILFHEDFLTSLIKGSKFLVIGGAGSIGKAVTPRNLQARSQCPTCSRY